jgi:hypothetical protein
MVRFTADIAVKQLLDRIQELFISFMQTQLKLLSPTSGKKDLIILTLQFHDHLVYTSHHEFCLEEDEKPSSDNLENWVCQKCQFCTVCGQQKNVSQI